MSKVYPRKTTRKPAPTDPNGLAIIKLTKELAQVTKLANNQQRQLKTLDKRNKYLQDRVSNVERQVGYFERSIRELQGKVARVMGIFKQ